MNEKEILCPKCGRNYDAIAHWLVCPHCGTPTHVQYPPWFIEIKDETFKVDLHMIEEAAQKYASIDKNASGAERMNLYAGFMDGTLTLLHLLSL